MVPPSEGCLYGHINWSLVQVQQQSSMGLFQSFLPVRGGKARPSTEFHFIVLKRPVPESSGAFLTKRPHLESRIEVAGSLLVSLPVLLMLERKGDFRVDAPDILHPTFSSSSSSVLQVGILSHFWINEEALLPTGLCLIWFRVTIFSLGHILPDSMISSSLMLGQL